MHRDRSNNPSGTWSQLAEGIFDLLGGEVFELLINGALRLVGWACVALLKMFSSF